MKTLCLITVLLVPATLLWGDAAGSASGSCEKSISFAITAGGEPVTTVPGFAAEWIANEKHQQRYPGFCFAQSPDPRAKNYTVMFAAHKEDFEGLSPSVLKYMDSSPVSADSAIKTLYGEMWHYKVAQPAALNATTLNLLHVDTSVALYARAYNEQGVVVSELSLKDISGWFHTRQKLLERIIEEIRSDKRPINGAPAAIKASLPVYYVNCDVPVKSLSSDDAAGPVPAPTNPLPATSPQPVASVEFWSTPPGADVYVDGGMIGKTPLSLALQPGEHTITMRKENFGTWQRRLQITEGKRKISGYLDQKIVSLGLATPELRALGG